MLRAKLGELARELVLAGPELDAGETAPNALESVDEALEGIRFRPLFPMAESPLGFLRRLPKIAAALREEVLAAEVVHSNNSQLYRPFEFMALLLASFLGKNTISVTDIDHRRSAMMRYRAGYWTLKEYLSTRLLHDPFQHVQQQFGVRRFSLVLLKSAALVRDYGAARPNVKNFLDSAFSREHLIAPERLAAKLREIEEPETPLRVVYFGRLASEKGILAMLRAVARALERGARVRFDIIGNGPEEASLRASSRALGIDGFVRFVGAVPFGPTLFEHLYRSHILLAAPISEDTPRSALDANAAGIAVLAYDTQYYRELASGGAGVELVPWGDVEALGDRLAELGDRRGHLGALMKNGVEFAAENTQEVWLDRRVNWTRGLFELAES